MGTVAREVRRATRRIERWSGEGTVFPFSIVRLYRAQQKKPGTAMEAFVVE